MDTPLFLSVGYIILDDIVFPDGRTKMATLGGAVTHAAMGMRMWKDHVGLVAALGRDFPDDVRAALARHFNTRTLVQSDIVTPRFWQLYEEDGRRTEVFRTALDDMLRMFPLPKDVPALPRSVRGAYLDCEPPDNLRAWIRHLRETGAGLILWEPWERYCLPENRAEIGRLASEVDAIALSVPEARQLTGLEDPRAIIAQLLEDGAHRVALRMGARGSLVADENGAFCEIPAYPVTEIVDVTGAGNAYCGGFIVGLERTGDICEAGRYGAVSASLVIEHNGALLPLDGLRAEAEQRLRLLSTDAH